VEQLFRDYGIHYLITPMPPETEYLPVQHFIEQWTAPAGESSGRFELRKILATAVVIPRKIDPAPPGSYDDFDPRIEYSRGWLHDDQFKSASGGTVTYTDRPTMVARFVFKGSGIRYVYTTTFNRGIVEIAIDQKVRARVNLYSPQTQWQQQTSFTGLGPGPHTIELRVTDKKDPLSSGYFVDVDRFDVQP
jgi:hypothetical protein